MFKLSRLPDLKALLIVFVAFLALFAGQILTYSQTSGIELVYIPPANL